MSAVIGISFLSLIAAIPMALAMATKAAIASTASAIPPSTTVVSLNPTHFACSNCIVVSFAVICIMVVLVGLHSKRFLLTLLWCSFWLVNRGLFVAGNAGCVVRRHSSCGCHWGKDLLDCFCASQRHITSALALRSTEVLFASDRFIVLIAIFFDAEDCGCSPTLAIRLPFLSSQL
jgi:hypothetical protein